MPRQWCCIKFARMYCRVGVVKLLKYEYAAIARYIKPATLIFEVNRFSDINF